MNQHAPRTASTPKSHWGPKLFIGMLVLVLFFFWWLLIYSHGVAPHQG